MNQTKIYHIGKKSSLFEFASALTEETRWHGNHDEKGKELILKAGCLSMFYEKGNLRYISNGNCEIIRLIHPAVRNKEWLTVRPAISDEEIEINKDSFRIGYSCHYLWEDINFLARYSIVGSPDNSIVFSLEGEALNTFEKNRIGFCVLHPILNYGGESCRIIHSNGESETLRFPESISPHQPFSDIKSMRWKKSGLICSLDFYGDVFETEDQRNWTDASYKTYSTPLEIPYPVKIEKGIRLSQRTKFKVEKGAALISVYPEKVMRLPSIGIGRSTRQTPLTDSEIKILRMSPPCQNQPVRPLPA